MTAVRFCAVIPTFDNPATIGEVVSRVRRHVGDVFVIDDGSGEEGRSAVATLSAQGLARTRRLERNGGKGAAVKAGLALSWEYGFTHALQVDADGQHDYDDIPRFLTAARERPDALVLGAPTFDESVPRARLWGRRLTTFWAAIETRGRVITDPMCGFRVYPLAKSVRSGVRGDRMDFDPEIAVRLVLRGVPVVNLPTRVRYLSAAEGGVSHFRLFRDNVLISWMHTRLVFLSVALWLAAWFGARAR